MILLVTSSTAGTAGSSAAATRDLLSLLLLLSSLVRSERTNHCVGGAGFSWMGPRFNWKVPGSIIMAVAERGGGDDDDEGTTKIETQNCKSPSFSTHATSMLPVVGKGHAILL